MNQLGVLCADNVVNKHNKNVYFARYNVYLISGEEFSTDFPCALSMFVYILPKFSSIKVSYQIAIPFFVFPYPIVVISTFSNLRFWSNIERIYVVTHSNISTASIP